MLVETIGVNAGLIWKALEQGEMEIKDLKKVAKLTEKDMYLALGWLSREGKVNFNEAEKNLFVSLI